MSAFWRRPVTTDRLINRVLRFIRYNFYQYQAHRQRGEYQLAVQRLRRMQSLIVVLRDIETTRGGCMAIGDDTEIRRLEQHIDAMFNYARAMDYSRVLDEL
jgi:hypothetical protein